MWRIFGYIFYGDKGWFLESPKAFSEEKAKAFCMEKGIALGDTAMEVIRLKDNASDNFLQVEKPIEPSEILVRIPRCTAIAVTGQKALDTIMAQLPPMTMPKIGEYSTFNLLGREYRLYRNPSSSRAYPRPIEEKALVYKKMFEELGIL